MKNVDCDYMGFESHKFRHAKVSKGWFRSWWPKQCIEYKDVVCPHRESIWDELTKVPTLAPTLSEQQGIGRGMRQTIKIKLIA